MRIRVDAMHPHAVLQTKVTQLVPIHRRVVVVVVGRRNLGQNHAGTVNLQMLKGGWCPCLLVNPTPQRVDRVG